MVMIELGPCHHGMASPANTLNKQSRTAEKGWFYSLGVGRVAKNSSPQKIPCYEKFHKTSDLD
jgi:hypothetical protein